MPTLRRKIEEVLKRAGEKVARTKISRKEIFVRKPDLPVHGDYTTTLVCACEWTCSAGFFLRFFFYTGQVYGSEDDTCLYIKGQGTTVKTQF